MQGSGTQPTNAAAAVIEAADARRRLIEGLPVVESRTICAGISTAVLEGGSGQPVVLLHDPGGYAAKWRSVIPELARRFHVIAPDLPGHGETEMPARLDDEVTLAWLDELIEQSCPSAPVLVGLVLGGAIAARYALRYPARVRQLVLVDSLGLHPFDPAPEFGSALGSFLARPSRQTHDELWRFCAHDAEALRARMAELWEPFTAYNLDRARTPHVQAAIRALMEQFGFPALPESELARLTVPTALIWGRNDLATSINVAREASTRFAWPLHIIDGCADDPPIERPRVFLDALATILAEVREVRA